MEKEAVHLNVEDYYAGLEEPSIEDQFEGMEGRNFFEKDDWEFVREEETKTVEWIAFKTGYPVRKLLTILGQLRRGRIFYCRHTKLKQNGKIRIIDEPRGDLKIIQTRIKDKLFSDLPTRKEVHGFSGGNVVGALKPHLKSKHFLMLDIKDAFPSINSNAILNFFLYGKMSPGRSVFLAPGEWDGHFSWRVSKILIDLCIFQKMIPQGSPISPRIFDLVFHEIDETLLGFSNDNDLVYTRYADNLFFSSRKSPFTKDKLSYCIVSRIEAETFPHLDLTCHKIRVYNDSKEAIRSLGLNIIGDKLHNTRKFKRRLRLHVHRMKWLKKNGQDYEESYHKLMGMMGWAIPNTLPLKLWKQALYIKRRMKEK